MSSICRLLLSVTLLTLCAFPAGAAGQSVHGDPAPYVADVVAGLFNASRIDVDERGLLVWSRYRHDSRRYELVLGRADGSEIRVLARRRHRPFDATIGRLSGLHVAVWSQCRRQPVLRRQFLRFGEVDYASGGDCRLRALDLNNGRVRKVHTGRGSVFLPTISEGRLLFFRDSGKLTSIIEQTLAGRHRRSHGRVTDTPTSLDADARTIGWTTAVPGRLAPGQVSTPVVSTSLFTRSRAGGPARRRGDGEIPDAAYPEGPALASVQVVNGVLAYLTSNASVASHIRFLPAEGSSVHQENAPPASVPRVDVPASTSSITVAAGQPLLAMVGGAARPNAPTHPSARIARAWPP